MARPANHWGDDDREGPDYHGEHPQRRRDKSGGISAVTVILVVLSVGLVLGVVVCGGLAWFGVRQAEEARREAEAEAQLAQQARIQERIAHQMQQLQQAAAPGPDQPDDAENLPPPKLGSKPAADPPPQPKATKFDAVASRWFVLFRSKKPELWNTNTQAGDDFALPLRNSPKEIDFLRLRRMDTGEAIIIPMTRNRLAKAEQDARPVRWNGEGKNEHGGYHLGIAEGTPAKFMEGKGTIAVLMDGWTANPGSGFGHAHHVDDGGQRFTWLGKEIKPSAFEVAVTAADLTDAERRLLRE
jgi:hypothetical protein